MTRAADALYRLLLRAFPAAFRATHGREMVRVFRRQRRERAGRPVALAALWLRAIRDALSQGVAARFGSARLSSEAGAPTATSITPRSQARWLGEWWRDVRLAARSLARAPVPTLAAILALGLGIGANAAIVTVVHDVLVDPLPYPHADRIVLPWRQHPSLGGLSLSPRLDDVDRWRGARSLDAITTYSSARLTLDDGARPQLVDGVSVEPSLLEIVGARPVVGRPFTPGDVSSVESARVVLLSEPLWRARFGADPAVVGRTIALDDVRHEIVGVLPATFRLPLTRPDVVRPLVPPAPSATGDRRVVPISTIARLAPGVSIDTAEDELGGRLDPGEPGWTVRLRTGSETLGLAVREALMVLLAAVGCVLLIGCVNATHLLLARNVARGRELAIRASLGATRARLLVQLLTEHVALATAAGALGAVAAWLALEGLAAWHPDNLPALAFVRTGVVTYVVSAGLALVTGLAVGLAPAWSAARSAVALRRADSTRSVTDARSRWVRRGLNVAEVALALVLLCGASLLLRSYLQLASRDLGFDPRETVALEVELVRSRYPTAAEKQAFFETLAETVRRIPDVSSVAMSVLVPPRGGLFFTDLQVEGRSEPPQQTQFDGGVVSPGFFSTLRVPILEGRGFVDADVREDRPVVVVSARTARRLWPEGGAVGRRLRLGANDPWTTVVGVAGDVRSSSTDDSRLQIYLPLTPAQFEHVPTLVVRGAGDTGALLEAIRTRVGAADPRLAIASLRTLESDVAGMNVRPRFNATLLGLLAAIGLVLAITGVYGVINYSVGLRTRELGVRVALGASPRALGRRVLGEAALVGAIGAGVGLALWPLFGRMLETLLVGLGTTDAATLAGTAALLTLATVAAAWLPARRAVRVDPVVALRQE